VLLTLQDGDEVEKMVVVVVAEMVEALCYKPEGRGFEYR
jgi:hypothetical protein